MENPITPHPALSNPDAQALEITPQAETPTPPQKPDVNDPLNLWELMRKDVPSAPPSSDTSRVLSNLRPSIWDFE